MEPLYIIIALAVISVVSFGLYLLLRSRTPAKTTESLYSDGLRALLEGELHSAAEKMKEVVQRDTNHIDAYIKLGDIFRENGQFTQALKVHQSLTVRRNLSPGQKIDIFRSLIQDFQRLEEFEKALSYANRILDIDKKNIDGHRAKLDIYLASHQWERASEVLASLQKITGKDLSQTLALYKVEEGRQLEGNGEKREGRIRYRKALKIYEDCCAALYSLGNSYDEEDRTEEAVKYWEEFGKSCPELLYLVSEKLEQRLFQLGNFSEVERYYRRLLEKHPDNIEAATGIAAFYDKKGETKNAIRVMETALDKNPDSIRGRISLIRFYNKEKVHKSIDDQIDALHNYIARQQVYTCEDCGYQTSKIFWVCPECYGTPSLFEK